MASIDDDSVMVKQQRLGWKRGSAKNTSNKAVPDFGDLMDEDCAMVEVQTEVDMTDAPSLPNEPRNMRDDRPLSPGAILEKAEQDAAKMKNSSTAAAKIIKKDAVKTVSFWKLPTREETEVNEYPELDHLFDFESKADGAYPLTYDPDTGKPYDIFYDPNNFNNSDYVPIRDTLQAEPVFERIDARVSPEPEDAEKRVAETGGDKKRKRKTTGKRKSRIIVDADVEMLENWTAEVDEKLPVDYGKMRREQRKRFEKMGIYR